MFCFDLFWVDSDWNSPSHIIHLSHTNSNNLYSFCLWFGGVRLEEEDLSKEEEEEEEDVEEEEVKSHDKQDSSEDSQKISKYAMKVSKNPVSTTSPMSQDINDETVNLQEEEEEGEEEGEIVDDDQSSSLSTNNQSQSSDPIPAPVGCCIVS